MKHDPVIERSRVQQVMRVQLARMELAPYGYSIVKSDWLRRLIKRLPASERADAMVEVSLG